MDTSAIIAEEASKRLEEILALTTTGIFQILKMILITAPCTCTTNTVIDPEVRTEWTVMLRNHWTNSINISKRKKLPSSKKLLTLHFGMKL
jgi:hypothetical protein